MTAHAEGRGTEYSGQIQASARILIANPGSPSDQVRGHAFAEYAPTKILKTNRTDARRIQSMAHALAVSRPLHVLLSEGASTSAREAVTVMGLAGHVVQGCDPHTPFLAGVSPFVRKFHLFPCLAEDPAALLGFIEKLPA